MYTIKELADLAGSTPRALRYYDQLGLLKPALIAENGYRYYDRENLLCLQQILFFRELDVPLKDIQFALSRPEFQLLPSLERHRRALQDKISRYEKLITTIDQTILNLEGEMEMSEKELFSGFDEKEYEDEARERWGDTPQYKESRRKWSSYPDAQKEKIKQLGGEITRRMVAEDARAQPGDPAVQAAVGEYYQYLNRYFYTCDVEFLRGLADMWVQDPRFAVNYERIREGGAAFVREAVQIFCDAYQQGG
jgi:DNA-binding transcriptional MerR regulator